MCVSLELERTSTAVRKDCVEGFTFVPCKLQQVLPHLLVQEQS